MKTWNLADKKIFDYTKFSHWIDYLTFWLSSKEIVESLFTDRIFNLDTDNSNFWAVRFDDEVLSIQKYKSPSWYSFAYSVVFNWASIPIFVINEFSYTQKDFCNNQWGVIHFYWAYYRLIELNHFSKTFIESINKLFLESPISRLDYRFDFLNKDEIISLPWPKEVLPYLRNNKKRKLYHKWPKLQSWEVWNKVNKTVFIRLYNKIDELEWNLKKLLLYWDLKKEDVKTFFRLEYEFWYKWCAWYFWKDILKLINKAFKTSWLEPSNFKWNLYKPQVCLDLSNEIDKLRYIKIFKSMAKNLKQNWINVISLIK